MTTWRSWSWRYWMAVTLGVAAQRVDGAGEQRPDVVMSGRVRMSASRMTQARSRPGLLAVVVVVLARGGGGHHRDYERDRGVQPPSAAVAARVFAAMVDGNVALAHP